MDGNGRWAKQRGQNRTAGHEVGAKVARAITQKANELDIKYITLYAFSTENWKRPKVEVEFLMKLLERYLDNERKTYLDNNIRFKTIGNMTALSKRLRAKIETLTNDTAHHSGVTQVLAINYGSHDEILRAFEKLGHKPQSPLDIENALDTAGMPPVDILIRTGGEKRLSNFLLWQAAYAELFFTDTLWPDFSDSEFETIISEFKTRNRRFGGI
jgi:undecaprenyl diphosphate synthase